ncbi:MAG: hypothetical protein H6628_04125 [Calditrichae bacterium]|nr:hypothetical protein [Calditrichia bacterium]
MTGTFAVLLGSFWLINQSFSTGATPENPSAITAFRQISAPAMFFVR